jgi:hypothetical protein
VPGTVPDGWTATLVVSWSLLSLAQPPDGCTPASPNSATCPVSATSPPVMLRALPVPGSSVRFELTDFSFADSDATDNVQVWSKPLLGLRLPFL